MEQGPRLLEHFCGPAIDSDRLEGGVTIEARHVAVAIMKAHQPMHPCDRAEGRIDRALQHGLGKTGRFDLHIGPEQRTRPSHCLPFKLATCWRTRLTPSVTCLDESVAPLILVMSLLSS